MNQLPIEERTTSVLIFWRGTTVAPTGTAVSSAPFGPGAGKLWRLTYQGASAWFGAVPVAADTGSCVVEITTAAGTAVVVSANVAGFQGRDAVAVGVGGIITMDDTMQLRRNVDARNSTVQVNGDFCLWGYEYDPI